jgi:preprotein translocase subunit YajC
MFVSPAYAQAAGGGPAGFELVSFLPLILIFVVFWFLMIRPQQKKMKQHREMIAAIRRGDRILTSGGIFGTVTKVLGEAELQVEIADGVRVRIARGTVSEVLAKTEPAKRSAAEDDEEEEEVEEASEVKGRSAKG